MKESLHPELINQISKLVWNDNSITIDEVKHDLDAYVLQTMFADQTPPPRTRRQYFPSKKQIRYFITKAKAALNIGDQNEKELEAQTEKYKQSHKEEKILYNFRVKNEVDPDLGVSRIEESIDGAEEGIFSHGQQQRETKNPKVIFCHQTPHQQRLLKRYSGQLFVVEMKEMRSRIPFPLFCLFVQTNVDYQLVALFILYSNHRDSIIEGLSTVKEWNPGWNPKFVICDFNDEQILAVDSVFPGKVSFGPTMNMRWSYLTLLRSFCVII